VGRGTPPTGERVWRGDLASPRKKMNFALKWRVLLNSKRYILSVSMLTLHYNASNLVLEILKHDKIWRDILQLASTTPNSGVVASRLSYARVGYTYWL